jgi:hypothetical protein
MGTGSAITFGGSDVRRFRTHYPEWQLKYDFEAIVSELHEAAGAETWAQ